MFSASYERKLCFPTAEAAGSTPVVSATLFQAGAALAVRGMFLNPAALDNRLTTAIMPSLLPGILRESLVTNSSYTMRRYKLAARLTEHLGTRKD